MDWTPPSAAHIVLAILQTPKKQVRVDARAVYCIP